MCVAVGVAHPSRQRGAILAANDSDIQTFAGDTYVHVARDGALVAYGLALAGQSELSRSFSASAMTSEPSGWFRHKYNPNGPSFFVAPEVLDGRQVLAVQQDETALVLWALRDTSESTGILNFSNRCTTRS